MEHLHVKLGKNSYDISFDTSFWKLLYALKDVGAPKKLFVVTDTNVEKLYLPEVMRILSGAGYDADYFAFSAGEENKNMSTILSIVSSMMKHGMDRKSMVIALGGGVVGDMAGFASAIYMRGIDYIGVPTTILSQSDSSVGGKTGIDFGGAKNIIGAFLQPKHVFINVSTVKTLPEREIISGLGEVIKHGIIRSEGFFEFLEKNVSLVKSLDEDTLLSMSKTNCAIKASVVEKDEKESGIRAHLNFGHTIGHAVESASDFKLSHGECVGLGMISASYIALARGYITKKDYDRIYNLLENYGFSVKTEIPDIKRILSLMKQDKKTISGKIRFVLPLKIGEVDIFDDVTEEEIISAIGVISE